MGPYGAPMALKRVVGGPLIFSEFSRIFTFSTPGGGASDPILGKWVNDRKLHFHGARSTSYLPELVLHAAFLFLVPIWNSRSADNNLTPINI